MENLIDLQERQSLKTSPMSTLQLILINGMKLLLFESAITKFEAKQRIISMIIIMAKPIISRLLQKLLASDS